jgi:hypothetical protein
MARDGAYSLFSSEFFVRFVGKGSEVTLEIGELDVSAPARHHDLSGSQN